MSKDTNVRRCIQCNKILVGDSKVKLCPKCANKDAQNGLGGIALMAAGAIVVKKAWKPTKELIKTVAKIALKR